MDAEEIYLVWQQASQPALNHAGVALKKFSGLDFAVRESNVTIVPWQTLTDRLNRTLINPLYAVHLKAVGFVPADIILGFSEKNAQRLATALIGEFTELPLDEMGLSALQEVGNIVGTAYLNVFSDLFGQIMEPTTPKALLTTVSALTSDITLEATVLLADAYFEVPNQAVAGQIVVIPRLPDM